MDPPQGLAFLDLVGIDLNTYTPEKISHALENGNIAHFVFVNFLKHLEKIDPGISKLANGQPLTTVFFIRILRDYGVMKAPSKEDISAIDKARDDLCGILVKLYNMYTSMCEIFHPNS